MSKSDLFKIVSKLSLEEEPSKLEFKKELDFNYNNIYFTILWTEENDKFLRLKEGSKLIKIEDQVWTPNIRLNNLKKEESYQAEFKFAWDKKQMDVKFEGIKVLDFRN